MSTPVLSDALARLVAFSDGRLTGLVRRVCAQTVSLAPLPVEEAVGEPESEAEVAVAEFAEQFSADVSMVTADQRSRLIEHLGDNAFPVVVAIFIADFVPRVRAGLESLGIGSEYLGWVDAPIGWVRDTNPAGELFNRFLPGVARMRAVDAVTSELVRLRGATAHNCRLCKSLREGHALDAGGSESLYDEISHFETSILLDERAKAALRYADALIWTPAHLAVDDAVEVRSRFSPEEAVELTLDIMRNASNKIAVSLGADAPRVDSGTERYLIDVDGQTVFS
ncbi:carboxymuconolactone decarboxylase family protein [Mycobacterium vicinigordonae]|uniref:Carboxymuconolactone decarboxylase family protein n=1 Tax=Mycobacterium vicinigordonae TaxID=1719132 RepID=A0A7D6I6E2_9MYCO|nr:carboxymuconolactone decarboxylase family protein [Mycobacterium vicinigordonae]QLL05737.1 carboxymuconolactone decarboxylase family protein [Mycobacterium vicinigordonae]